MEDLLEFLFGASGRINRAKYWRSLLILGVAGIGVILLTAAGIAPPLFIVMIVIVFIPWLMWAIAITPSGYTTATRARGGSWYSTGCRQCSAARRKLPGLQDWPVP
jgi:uncharacterized membrane protein YhaH (DUF805 family)